MRRAGHERPARLHTVEDDVNKTYNLWHPLYEVPAVALVEDYYRKNGRVVGLVLRFCDGHTAAMTYAEIRAATIDEQALQPVPA